MPRLRHVLAILLVCYSSARAATLCGTVRERDDGAPVQGAAVTVNGVRSPAADAHGRFTVAAVGPQGNPTGTIVVVSGAGIGTRVLRIADAWWPPATARPDDGCVSLTVDVAPFRGGVQPPIDATTVLGDSGEDADHDRIDDRVEDWLAERFAPIVHHDADETSFPVDVDWWLTHTHLSVLDGSGRRRVRSGPLTQAELVGHTVGRGEQALVSNGSRSRTKAATFYLDDVLPPFRAGQRDPHGWVTYVHAFGNETGGITLQYWRAYAWNPAKVLLFDVSHGGDWEGIAVHLDASLAVQRVASLDHAGIVYERDRVRWEGTHPLVWSEPGGHASGFVGDPARVTRWIRQQSWSGGNSGGLLNVGEKTRPLNGQQFIAYSGLWGSPGVLFYTSGYWGPAFNETGARCADGRQAYTGLRHHAAAEACAPIFLTAWCDGMDARLLDVRRECHAVRDTP